MKGRGIENYGEASAKQANFENRGGRWEDSGEKCPKCDKETQMLVKEEVEPTGRAVEYNIKERCLNCGWEVDLR